MKRDFARYFTEITDTDELVELAEEASNYLKYYIGESELQDVKSGSYVNVEDSDEYSGVTENVVLLETANYYVIRIEPDSGSGWGMYAKDDWTIEDAVDDQAFYTWEIPHSDEDLRAMWEEDRRL